MKNTLLKTAFLFFIAAPLFAFPHGEKFKGRHTKEKTIKKEFEVNPDALLKVDNSYGNLNISSWSENRILIEVHIQTNGNNEDRVQRKLDEITVEFDGNPNTVSAKTILNSGSSGWGWGWGNNNNVNMQIDYTIKLPIKNSVNLSNDYGSIILDRVDGHAKISCDYGRLDIGELRGRNNELSFDYTSRSSIGYINSGKINADYSGFTIDRAGNIDLAADYTDSKINEMENLNYKCDYGKLEVGQVKNLEGKGDYINVDLGTLHGSLKIGADYGSIKVEEIAEDGGNLDIRSSYTGIKIGYSPQYHFNFDIKTSYAGVSGKQDFEIMISHEKNNSNEYQGYHGSQNSGNIVSISSSYGGITFNKN